MRPELAPIIAHQPAEPSARAISSTVSTIPRPLASPPPHHRTRARSRPAARTRHEQLEPARLHERRDRSRREPTGRLDLGRERRDRKRRSTRALEEVGIGDHPYDVDQGILNRKTPIAVPRT